MWTIKEISIVEELKIKQVLDIIQRNNVKIHTVKMFDKNIKCITDADWERVFADRV